jgi:hypothetical protein
MRQRKALYSLVSLISPWHAARCRLLELLPTVSCEVSFPRPIMPFVGELDLRSLFRLRRDMVNLGMTDLFYFHFESWRDSCVLECIPV